MANATLRDLTAATDIAATDVLVIQNTDLDGAYYKITGTNFGGALESGGGIELSLAAAQAAAAGADTRIQYNNGTARGGDAEVTWDNSGKALTVGAVTATTQLKLPQSADPATPTLAFGDGDTGLYEQSNNTLRFATGASGSLVVDSGSVYMQGVSGFQIRGGLQDEAASATNPTLTPLSSDLDTGVGLAAADKLSLIAGGVELSRLSESATDQVMFYVPKVSLIGGDLNIKQNIRDNWFASSFGMYVDETNHKLEFWAMYADGTTAKKHELALA
jgi:hypothetical protein